jgi:hypothetical protein
MAYLGNTPTTQSFISGTDYFNGTGSQTAFTLTRTVASVNDIEAVVNNVVQQPNDAYNISGTTITFTSAPSAGTNNVYVRYLSTTTQAITPSQNTVNYNTFDSNMQSAIGTAMKNRIINGAMVIDQRNAGASGTGNDNFVVDRWKYNSSQTLKLTWQQNAGSVTPPAGFTNYLGVTSSSAYALTGNDYFQLAQIIEGFNVADLGWGTANAKACTLSFWVRSSLTGTFGGSIATTKTAVWVMPFSYTISSANTWTYITVPITAPTSTGGTNNDNTAGVFVRFGLGSTGTAAGGTVGTWTNAGNYIQPSGTVSVVGTNGATFYITGVQLEVGTQATSFEYRQYGTELDLCQRYYQNSNGACPIANGTAFTTTVGSTYCIRFPTQMRSAPTLTSSTLGVDWGDASAASSLNATSPSLRDTTTTGTGITVSHSAVSSVSLILYVKSGGYIAFSSEL